MILFKCPACKILQFYQNQRVFISNLECIFCGKIVLLPNENSLLEATIKKPKDERKVWLNYLIAYFNFIFRSLIKIRIS